ncbi:hypothetical protein L228DRAFT_241252 [Xylona heveae TC161]|uniref:Vacuolar protein sorting-associated protein 62 n=1 Tax=Xylona heveae (strain CBS 132557 / TC161) TaxID=1328760 RepID=A0A165A7H2_XYLHT|nr:hypothetical protein L228DRAFT_241252 [Xylona heveae TC161]KZF20061.1 hypothetical protein L228DRAFT_241252 [Xylona heveae TC161]
MAMLVALTATHGGQEPPPRLPSWAITTSTLFPSSLPTPVPCSTSRSSIPGAPILYPDENPQLDESPPFLLIDANSQQPLAQTPSVVLAGDRNGQEPLQLQPLKDLISSPLAESDSLPQRCVPNTLTPTPCTDLVGADRLNDSLASASLMPTRRRATLAIFSTLLGLFTFGQLSTHAPTPGEEGQEEVRWVASSHSWLDRQTCQWLGMCGVAHFRTASSEIRRAKDKKRKEQVAMMNVEDSENTQDSGHQASSWLEGKTRPEDWSDDERVLREIPQYVLDYAPLVHLFSGEQFWPCDIEEHLHHVTPHLNYTPLFSEHLNLTNLSQLNKWDNGRHVYLQSDDDVEGRPEWLGGEKNVPSPGDLPEGGEDHGKELSWAEWDGRIDGDVPDEPDSKLDQWWDVGIGSTKDRGGRRPNPTATEHIAVPTNKAEGEDVVETLRRRAASAPTWKLGKRVQGGRSDAPAVLLVVDKGDGVVDAFWFFFYSYNLGNVVLNVRFGNHVGDWEHTVIRFHKGKPKAVFFSEHSGGEAYNYEAVQKIGKRPVAYSAVGTHAMYATPGTHSYILPWGMLHDLTDRGPLWDPLLNSHAYTYDYINDTLRSSQLTPHAPTDWFYYSGHWGDKFYPLSDHRQYRFAGQYHYVNGPFGPRFKNLGRKRVCQGNGQCHLRNWLPLEGTRSKRWTTRGVGESQPAHVM